MLEGMQITIITREAFNHILLKYTNYNYENYGLVSGQVLELGIEGVKWAHCKHLESRLD